MKLEPLSAGHGALTAMRTGAGPDIVILHSLLTDRHAFDSVLPLLAARHRVTLVNLPGFYGSQPTLVALMDAYVATIEGGFDEFAIGRDCLLIGNGFGGTIAMAFAIAHPDRIGKLLLSDAAACFPLEGRRAFAAMAEKVAEQGLAAVAEIAAERVHSPDYLKAHPEVIEERKQVLLGIDSRAFAAACKILQTVDFTPMLRHLQLPTLVVCGALDQATPPALNREIAQQVPGALYVELAGCGQCPPLEQPEAFNAAIKEFAGL